MHLGAYGERGLATPVVLASIDSEIKKKVLLKIVTPKLGLVVYWENILRISKFP